MAYTDQQSRGISIHPDDSESEIGLFCEPQEPKSLPVEALSQEILDLLSDIQSRIIKIESKPVSVPGEEVEYSEDIKFYKWLKMEYANRHFRHNAFEQEYITGEPCWDALLDLCIAEIEGRRVGVTSLCIASGVPVTTALRWLSLLERDGMIERQADPRDKRRTFIRITKRTFENMFEYHQRIAKRRKSLDPMPRSNA